MKIWLERTLSGCRAADDESADVLKRLPVGTTFEADVVTRRTRSGAWHRRYWALMTILASNCECVEVETGLTLPIRDAESAHVACKYATGLFDSYTLRGGVVRVIKSTKFDKMDADEWAAYWHKLVHIVSERFLPGVGIPEIEAEIARLAA